MYSATNTNWTNGWLPYEGSCYLFGHAGMKYMFFFRRDQYTLNGWDANQQYIYNDHCLSLSIFGS